MLSPSLAVPSPSFPSICPPGRSWLPRHESRALFYLCHPRLSPCVVVFLFVPSSSRPGVFLAAAPTSIIRFWPSSLLITDFPPSALFFSALLRPTGFLPLSFLSWSSSFLLAYFGFSALSPPFTPRPSFPSLFPCPAPRIYRRILPPRSWLCRTPLTACSSTTPPARACRPSPRLSTPRTIVYVRRNPPLPALAGSQLASFFVAHFFRPARTFLTQPPTDTIVVCCSIPPLSPFGSCPLTVRPFFFTTPLSVSAPHPSLFSPC